MSFYFLYVANKSNISYLGSQDRFVALKIMVSQVTDPIEIRNWKYLNEKADGELSQHYIAQIMDSFVHEGPNGSHHCLVSEFLGPSLDRFIKENNKTRTSKKVSMYDVGNIADMMQKVMKAVNFIHDAGLCHGGENSPSFIYESWSSRIEPFWHRLLYKDASMC